MKILVLAETDGGRVSEKSLPAIAFAQQKSPEAFTILAIGDNLQCIDQPRCAGACRRAAGCPDAQRHHRAGTSRRQVGC
jgi:hypothetical protein